MGGWVGRPGGRLCHASHPHPPPLCPRYFPASGPGYRLAGCVTLAILTPSPCPRYFPACGPGYRLAGCGRASSSVLLWDPRRGHAPVAELATPSRGPGGAYDTLQVGEREHMPRCR